MRLQGFVPNRNFNVDTGIDCY